MLYKLHNDGFVNSLDDSVTTYQSDFLVKNPFGSSPITLRWGFNFTMEFLALLFSGKSNSNALILLRVLSAWGFFRKVSKDAGKLLANKMTTLSCSFVIFSFHRELASHRSGLPREAPCYPATKTNFCPYTNNQMIQRLRDVTLLHEPGKEPHYRLENSTRQLV